MRPAIGTAARQPRSSGGSSGSGGTMPPLRQQPSRKQLRRPRQTGPASRRRRLGLLPRPRCSCWSGAACAPRWVLGGGCTAVGGRSAAAVGRFLPLPYLACLGAYCNTLSFYLPSCCPPFPPSGGGVRPNHTGPARHGGPAAAALPRRSRACAAGDGSCGCFGVPVCCRPGLWGHPNRAGGCSVGRAVRGWQRGWCGRARHA